LPRLVGYSGCVTALYAGTLRAAVGVQSFVRYRCNASHNKFLLCRRGRYAWFDIKQAIPPDAFNAFYGDIAGCGSMDTAVTP